MSLKRLSDVQTGQVIKIGGNKHKVNKTPFGILLSKEILSGIYASTPVDVNQVISNYRGPSNHLVEVVEVGTAPKSDLTSQLRAQQAQKSLTDSLRRQQEVQESYDDYEDEDEDEEDDSYDYYGYGFGDEDIDEVIEEIVDEVAEVKASTLATNLRAQQAQQTAQQAQKAAVQAQLNTTGVVGSLRDLSFEVNRVAEKVEDVQDYAYAVSDVAHNALRKVEAIESKQKLEETKMNIQNQLNASLAKQKQQAQLNASLQNQKTTGGNGTMKKLFGAAFNFGKVEGKFAFSPITGGLALRKGLTNDFVAYNKDTKELTDVSGLTLKFDVPAFKLPVAGNAVEVGDLIIHNAEYVYVTKKADGYLETLNPEKGVRGSVVPTKNALLNATFYTVVKTLDAAGGTGFNPMLLMAMSKGSDKSELLPLLLATGGLGGNTATAGGIDPTMLMLLGDDVEDLLPLVLMQQGGATGAGFNPLMFLAMNKGGKSKDLLPLLAMTGGLGGATQGQAGAINPMMMMALAGDGDIDFTTLALMGGLNGGGLFGQAPAPAAQGKKEVK